MTLKTYAERNGYTLAAVFGRHAWDTHYYYVRPGFPESAEIIDLLREAGERRRGKGEQILREEILGEEAATDDDYRF